MPDVPAQAVRALFSGADQPGPDRLFDWLPWLPASLLDAALEVARAIRHPARRDQALAALAARLLEAGRPFQALDAARQVEDDIQRVRVLTDLAPGLPAPRRDQVVAELLEVAGRSGPVGNRAHALAALAPYLPGPLLARALEAACQIDYPSYQAEALAGLAPYLPETLQGEALAAARRIGDEAGRTQVLEALARGLAPAWLDEALAAARELESSYLRIRVWAALAPRLAEPARGRVLTDGLAAARGFEEITPRFWSLARLAPHLTGPARGQVLAEALAEARAIEPLSMRVDALAELMPLLPEPLHAEALASARAMDDEAERARLLSELAPHLSQPLLAEALRGVRDFEHAAYRAEALGGLAPYLPQALMGEALAGALDVEESFYRAVPLLSLAPYLPETLMGAALAATRGLEDEGWRAAALAGLAPYLPPALIGEALAAARGLKSPDARVAALAGLAPRLPEPSKDQVLEEALAAARRIQGDRGRARALAELTPHLPAPRDLEALAEALELAAALGAKSPGAPWLPTLAAGSPLRGTEVPPTSAQQLLAGLSPEARAALLEQAMASLLGAVPHIPRERVVNTGFAPGSAPAAPLDATLPLAAGQAYYFWLEVGPALPGSIEEQPAGLPVDRVPSGARLQVALFAFEGEIEITPGADLGELELLSDGSLRVIRQPDTPQDPDLGERRLFFPVRAPDQAGLFRLRCHIYYAQILLQSRLVYAQVQRQPVPAPGALRAVVDYTLSQALQPGHLARLEPHQLSLAAGAEGAGALSFHFFGAGEFKNQILLDGQALADLIEQARRALRRASWGDEGEWRPGLRPRYGRARHLGQLSQDLVQLAVRGYRFYDALINRLAGGPAQAGRLAELMRTPGLVQIALKGSARHVLPAALIYDYDFDTGSRPGLCPAFLEALEGPAPLETCDCFQGRCPSRGQADVVCPSGFWGFRHTLGMPLSLAGVPDVPPEILYQAQPELILGVSTDPTLTLRPDHERALRALAPVPGWKYAATRDEALRLLRETSPHLIYFYCHGGVADGAPYLQVGPRDEPRITRDNLRFYKVGWETTRPLVFINGCRTTALTPEAAIELVSAFVEGAASGVIGSEITVFETLARAFGEEFLGRFLAGTGTSAGEAVRYARLAILKQGNPLGLVYIPYVIAGLRLVPAPNFHGSR